MLDAAQGSSLAFSQLLDPQVIASASTVTSPSTAGYWLDQTLYEGYILYCLGYGTITATSSSAQLESSATATGGTPLSGGTSAAFAAILAANSPAQQSLLLPANFFANRYVGIAVTTVGAGNTPVYAFAVGGLRSP